MNKEIEERFIELENMAIGEEFISEKIMELHNLVDQEISKLKEVPSSDIIDFTVYLSGHDEDTVKQMYDDYKNGISL
jgi:hypothetical protein